jgi:hypothetical protein
MIRTPVGPHPHRAKRVLAAAITLSVVALAACGGGSHDDAAAVDAVNAVVQHFGSSGSCTLLTSAGRRELSGETDAAACQHVLDQGAQPKFAIETTTVAGAAATVNAKGGEGAYTIRLTDASGDWLIDAVDQPGQSPSPADLDSLAAEFRAANAGYNKAFDVMSSQRARDAATADLTVMRDDAGAFRDALATYDSAVREIAFPASMRADADALIASDRAVITDFDSMASAATVAQYVSLQDPADADLSDNDDAATSVDDDLGVTSEPVVAPSTTTPVPAAAIADAAATRDAMLQAARTASYDSSTEVGDVVLHALVGTTQGLQFTNSVTDATPTQLSAYPDFVLDKVTGDHVITFAVADISHRCAAGAVAIPENGNLPTIFQAVTLSSGDACNAAAVAVRFGS